MTSSFKTLALLAALTVAPVTAHAIDWSGVPAKDVVLFYPGQTSWEYLLTPADHSGAPKFREGKTCFECHFDEPNMQGPLLISGRKNEPTPPLGKPGIVPAQIRFAYDDKALYVQLRFSEGAQPDMKMDAEFASKLTIMLGDAKVPEMPRAGCWVTCHDDVARMPSAATSDRTKYLPKTRAKLSRSGGGDELKPADELAKLKADGYVLEYWQARLNPGAKAQAANGQIFDKREDIKPVVVTADATFEGNAWTVTMTRPLSAPPFRDLVPGKPYEVGVALHSGHAGKRFHYVSYEYSLVLGAGAAEFVAVKK